MTELPKSGKIKNFPLFVKMGIPEQNWPQLQKKKKKKKPCIYEFLSCPCKF